MSGAAGRTGQSRSSAMRSGSGASVAPDIVGTRLLVDKTPVTIVGVAPPSFFGPTVGRAFDVALPIGCEPLLRGRESSLDQRANWWLSIMVRLRPGQTREDAQRVLRGVQPQIREATLPPDPDYLRDPMGVVSAEQGRSVLRGRYRDALWVLMAASLVVLLVTCANVANLLLARAHARRAEMSVRLAIGASRRRLVQQLLIESAVLSAVGALVGLAFAVWTSQLIVSQISTPAAPVTLDVALDWRLGVFTMAVALLVTPLFSILPALRATRLTPAESMKEQSRNGGWRRVGPATRPGAGARPDCRVAGAGRAGRVARGHLHETGYWPLGLESRRVVVATVTLQPDAVPEAERAALFERVRGLVAEVPGVAATTLAAIAPLSGPGWNGGIIDVDGTDVGGEGRRRMVWMNAVSDGFFDTYGIPLRDGRELMAADAPDGPPVMVVNEAFVARFLAGGPAVGRRVRSGVPGRPDTYGDYREIVGVVGDTLYRRDLRRDVEPTVFIPLTQVDGPPESRSPSRRGRGLPTPWRWSVRSHKCSTRPTGDCRRAWWRTRCSSRRR